MVVDGQVKVFPPDPPAPVLACALAGDPMSGALVAPHWLSRLQRRDAVEAKSTQHATDGGGRDDELARDLLAGQALTPERFDPLHRSGRRRPMQAMGPRRAILQPGQTLAPRPRQPLARRPRAHACGACGGLSRLPARTLADQTLSTHRRQTGILVDVHPVLSDQTEASQPQLPRFRPDGPNES
jgi:hypothetical protein